MGHKAPEDAFINAIIANPDDLGAHMAYADWLIEQGNPRGEFIQVQMALEDPKGTAQERQELQKREQELLAAHEQEWLGELASFAEHTAEPAFNYRFERGWLTSVDVDVVTDDMARLLAETPQTRLLTSIRCGEFEDKGFWHFIDHKSLTNLRQLVIGPVVELRESDFYYSSFRLALLVGIVDVVQALPRLQQLMLEGEVDTIEELFALPTLHNLQTLQICLASACPLEVLARNKSLTSLQYLMFHPRSNEEPVITLAGLQALVHSTCLPSLTKLRLHLTNFGDAGCAVIVKSGILKRLKVLDLGFGNITDAGAQMLANCPDLKNLELLDVQSNALTDAGLNALQQTGIDVFADWQHEPEDDAYLFNDEME